MIDLARPRLRRETCDNDGGCVVVLLQIVWHRGIIVGGMWKLISIDARIYYILNYD